MTDEEIKLLEECHVGAKMGAGSIRRVMEQVRSEDLKQTLYRALAEQEKLVGRFEELLESIGREPKDPGLMEQSSVVMTIGVKLMVDSSDQKIAQIMKDGADKGGKRLQEYLNQWRGEDERVSEAAEKLIAAEERFSDSLRDFV